MTGRLDPDYATAGGLLLAPDLYDSVAPWLRAEDFARPLCGEVYQLIEGMRSRAVPVDPVTVLGELRDRGRVRSDGYPATELIAMVEAVPVPASTPYYARLVLSAAVYRGVEGCGARLTQIGRAQRGNAGDALDLAASSFGALADTRRRWELATGSPVENFNDHGRERGRTAIRNTAEARSVGG